MLKRSVISVLLSLSLFFSPSQLISASEGTVLIDLDYSTGTNTDRAGNNWVSTTSIEYDGLTADFTGFEWMELNGTKTASLVNAISSDEDFYLSFKVIFDAFNPNKDQVFRLSRSGGVYGLVLRYDGYDKDWEIRMTDASLSPTYTRWHIPDTLETGKVYEIALTRDGTDLKLYRDSELIGSQPLGFNDTVAESSSWAYVGDVGSSETAYKLYWLKFVSGVKYTPVLITLTRGFNATNPRVTVMSYRTPMSVTAHAVLPEGYSSFTSLPLSE